MTYRFILLALLLTTPAFADPPDCLQDVNDNLIIGTGDLAVIGAHWGDTPTSPSWNPAHDVNSNNVVGVGDLVAVAVTWGMTCKRCSAKMVKPAQFFTWCTDPPHEGVKVLYDSAGNLLTDQSSGPGQYNAGCCSWNSALVNDSQWPLRVDCSVGEAQPPPPPHPQWPLATPCDEEGDDNFPGICGTGAFWPWCEGHAVPLPE